MFLDGSVFTVYPGLMDEWEEEELTIIIIIIGTRKSRRRRNKPTKCLVSKNSGVVFVRNEMKIQNQNPRFVTFFPHWILFFWHWITFWHCNFTSAGKGGIMRHDAHTKLNNKALLLLPPWYQTTKVNTYRSVAIAPLKENRMA